ncbi:MAG: carbohydrate kinase family protein [Actinomycetes bacterium]
MAVSGVLVVGEALVDVVVRPDGSTAEHPGGSPANVALGLARLGRETHLLTHLGDDDRGRLVADHLGASGVRLVGGSVLPGSTSVAQATLDENGSATYTFELEWALPATPLPPDPLAVHTGSIAAVLQPGAATVERIVLGARHHATVTYDPNLRPDLMGSPAEVRSHVEGLVAAADVVKLSEEDAAWLAPDTSPEHLIEQWLQLGPSVVVLTRGDQGALALCRAGQAHVPTPDVVVSDTVGAGDSFMSGLIDGLWSADLLGGGRRDALQHIEVETLTDVLRHAAAVAAVTVSRPGADPPTRAELS